MAWNPLTATLVQLEADLGALDQSWALVGGLAISALVDPRTTRDVDVVVSVADDQKAQMLVRDLEARGYRLLEVFEHEISDRLSTVRLRAPGPGEEGVVVDLLLASSGIEPEMVEAAQTLEIMPNLELPVARLGHLLAVKALAGRPLALQDARQLLQQATPEDLFLARESLDLISRRGFDRHKDLQAELDRLIDNPPQTI